MKTKIIKDRAYWLDQVSKSREMLKFVPAEFSNERQFILECISLTNRYVLAYMPTQFQEDKEILLAVLKRDGNGLEFVNEKMRNLNNKELVYVALREKRAHGFPLYWLSDEMKNDKDLVRAAVGNFGESFCRASENLKNDKDFVAELIQLDCLSFKFASKKLQRDKELRLLVKETKSKIKSQKK